MPPKRLLEGKADEPQKRQKRRTLVRLPEELEDEIAQWWEQNPILYNLGHHQYHRSDIKDELLRVKVLELQQSEQWGGLEVIQNMTVDILRQVMIIMFFT